MKYNIFCLAIVLKAITSLREPTFDKGKQKSHGQKNQEHGISGAVGKWQKAL
jgi:hypothetical protein